jgi:RNA polymerase sigma-70 factor (ECF subfamily)
MPEPDPGDDRLAAARAAWPGVEVDLARFAAHLDRLATSAPDAVLAVPELLLAFACADGDRAALAILERDYLTALRPALARLGLAPTAVDETLQVLRHDLLVARPAAPPRILDYGGRGALHGWLRAVATRTGLRQQGAAPRHLELDESRHAAVAGDDLELAYMKKTYGDAFRDAFAAALAALPADQRLLLKQRFRHQLTVEDLGRLHGVHAGTISRWVAAAREHLVKETRAEMMRGLGVGRADVDSILRLIHSQLEVSLSTREE